MQLFSPIQYTKWRLPLFLCLLAYLPGSAQTVENVRTSFDQSSQRMYISYDLPRLNYRKKIQIIPQILLGDTLLVPLKSLSGEVGWQTRGGKNKLIIWYPFIDGVNSLNGVQIKIKTELRDTVAPRFWGLLLQGSNSAPFGVKLMRLNQIGFFAGFRVGKLPPDHRYTISNTGEMDYLESGVYEVSSERRLASYAFTAGPVVQLAHIGYVYAGAGYGVEQLFWKYQAFNLNKNFIGSGWALNETIDRKGITADAGAVVRLGRVLLDLGLSTVQFKSFQITGGVGLSFPNK